LANHDANKNEEERIVVCLAYPALQQPHYIERLHAIDPRIEAISLPVDPESDWFNAESGEPHAEPPPWALGVAAERLEALSRAEAMITLHVPEDLPALAPRLRWLQGLGAGVEQFVAAGVPRDRVMVTNASGVSSVSISEFVIGRLLQIWKRFPETDEHQRAHRYARTYGRTFKASVIGIVGLGAIGSEVAVRARAMGLQVLGMKRSYRPGATSDLADELFGPDSLHEMLSRCDAVVVAAPASPETHHIINAAALAALKPGAVLVNVARGSLLDEAALVAAMESGHVAAAALDVFEAEPLPATSPLWDVPNLFVSAHSSVSVDRYMDDIFDLFEENVRRYAAGEALKNRVDMEALGFPPSS